MKFLEQCIKETMRMIPVVPMVGRTALEDLRIGEHVVPKGATIMVTPFLVHRNPEVSSRGGKSSLKYYLFSLKIQKNDSLFSLLFFSKFRKEKRIIKYDM